MSRHRILAGAAIGLCAALWTYACGDGATEPPTPPPDPLRPAAVTVAPTTIEFTALGSTRQLTAEVRDQNGRAMAGAAVAWSSGEASVATVDASGLVTAAGNGTASITATSGSASGSAAVTVAQTVSAVAVSPAADTLVARGDTVRLTTDATDANGHVVAGAEFAWTSSDTAVATVDASGLVASVGAGEAEVTATASEIAASASITVVEPAPALVEVTPGEVALTALGQTAQLTADVLDQIGRIIEGAIVSWASADTAVAAVDSAGLVTAVGGGASTVTASAGDASGEARVTVMQSVGSVVVTPAADTVAFGDTLRLAAEAFDGNGHRVEGASFEWSSSDVSVATVDSSGLVRGVAEGAARITAASADVRGTSEITVENPDRAALVALYNATDGPNWVDNTNWLTDAPLGEWYGVDTDASGRVFALDLSGRWDSEALEYKRHGLSGSLPAELVNLARLRSLYLNINELVGEIPAELAKLYGLRNLDLGGNRFTGPIPPELGRLANLWWLGLGGNQLSGPIPPELAGLSNLGGLNLTSNRLTGSIPAELGNLTHLQYLYLHNNDLTGTIPAELGNIESLRYAHLGANELTGLVPAELGNLQSLSSLTLGSNALTGPIPQTFLQLDRLDRFYIGRNEGLCVPGSAAFVAWLRGIERRDDESLFCNAADAAALGQLYELAGGAGWTRSDGWAGDGALEERHGVSADSLGRVTVLDLTANGLTGRLPPNLGVLDRMNELRIADNPGLSGRLPLSLADLSLRTLHYTGTGLCSPAETAFRDWLSTVSSHEGTGAECAPLSDREILGIFYSATGGPDWANNENWLTDAPLHEWHGVEVDGQGNVVDLDMFENDLNGAIPRELGTLGSLRYLRLWGNNDLTGAIPPELGDLSNLLRLRLFRNSLTGPIPPELGNLSNLTDLWLGNNSLTGPIPGELGDLAKLDELILQNNSLTGAIPPELGGLSDLTELWAANAGDFSGGIPPEIGTLGRLEVLSLGGNNLDGSIPPSLGELANLQRLFLNENNLDGPIPQALGQLAGIEWMWLQDNALSGPMPGSLGSLTTLQELLLSKNDLEGPLPPQLGGMSSLRELAVSNNPRMEGPLPPELTALARLEALLAGETGLCVPDHASLQTWLNGVHKRRIAACAEGDPPTAYLVQSVQSRAFPVPLVAGKAALLRVFPTARQATDTGIPPVRARFFVGGREVHVENIAGKSRPIPSAVDESSLSKSANAEIPAEIIQPGLEMVIEIDPDGTLDPALGVARRIPETGRLEVDVRAMPLFDLTLIPFIWSETRDSSIVDLVEAMAADPENHEMFSDTRALLPIGDLAVSGHDPVLSTSNSAFELIRQTGAIRAMEGGTGHWMGMIPRPVTGAAGIARLPGRWSFSLPANGVIAHELGHNLSLYHAPCGGAGGPDPSFPYFDGTVGAWGYDFRDGSLVRPSTPDLMTYCGPPDGVSDYHFTNSLRYRLFDEGLAVAARTESLLLWGGTDADGVPFLEPAFVLDASPTLPDSAGSYRLTGRTGSGAELFSFSFAMPEIADGDGSSSFVFAIPTRPGWEALASITLTGPGGSATLDGNTDLPMAILRNPRTGTVRGILRDLEPDALAQARATALSLAAGLEVRISRGLPTWR